MSLSYVKAIEKKGEEMAEDDVHKDQAMEALKSYAEDQLKLCTRKMV